MTSSRRHLLLINPTIAPRRSARFPLAVLNLSAALDGHYDSTIIDGNVDRDFIATALRLLGQQRIDAVGLSVMGGPQLPTAIAASCAIRRHFPGKPIIWGGHFPTICAEPALQEDFVDYAIRGQGEDTLRELLATHFAEDSGVTLQQIAGLSWRAAGRITHNPPRAFSAGGARRAVPYERLGYDPRTYLQRTFLGARTAGYQAALGCRFRCTFCGVAAMFRGRTALPSEQQLDAELHRLVHRYGVDSVQFYDNNFFDREEDTLPLLEVLARHRLPWWCFARSDALLNLSGRAWSLIRRSRLRMTYIGAESPSDWLLHDVRKGTRRDQTAAAVELCQRNGVIPELSFMLAPPQDPAGETERTFAYIHQIKRAHPTTEIMLYVYSPLPAAPGSPSPHVQRSLAQLRDGSGAPLSFPDTASAWAQPQWIDYWCHRDVPWLTPQLRQRIRDFTTVLGCRFPTATDIRAPRWGKVTLRGLAAWRYRYRRYGQPWELNAARKFIRLWDPRLAGL